MQTITIRLPDVEAAMLLEVHKDNKAYKDLQALLLQQIRQEYAKTPAGRPARTQSITLVCFLFHQRRAVGGVDLFFDGCPPIVLLIDRPGKVDKGFTKALLALLIPNGIFYLPEIGIDLHEALNELWINLKIQSIQCFFESCQLLLHILQR